MTIRRLIESRWFYAVLTALFSLALVLAFPALFHHPSWFAVPVAFGTISFNSIPTNVREPFVMVEFDNTKAIQGPGLLAYRVLIVGQKVAAGAWAANSINRATSVEQVIAGAGRGSMLHRMALAYFANNRTTDTYFAVLSDNGAGVAASGTLTFTGPATASGTLNLYLGGNLIQVAVASGDVQNTIATNVNAAINAAADLPVTSTVATNVVTITHRHKGLVGNDFDMRVNYQDGEATPAGVAVAVVALSGGTTNPVLTTLIAAMGDNWYNIIIHPYTDATSLTAIENELASRFGPLRMIDGVAITSAAGTVSTLGTLGNGRNSPSSSIAAQPGKNPLTPPTEFGAAVGAHVAFYGNIDPGRPFKTLAIGGSPDWAYKPPVETDRFTFSERNLLLYDGISTALVGSGGITLLSQMITTYKTAASGAADESYLLMNTLLIAMFVRYDVRSRIVRAFPRCKLADDGTRFGPGQAVVTPSMAKALLFAIFRDHEALGLVQNFEQFKRDVVVERDLSNRNRLNMIYPPTFINQFITGAAQVQFRL